MTSAHQGGKIADMDIEASLVAGAIFGVLVGFMSRNHKVGCATLFIVPVAMIIYISAWQSAHPENLRSTSGLDYLFVTPWPCIGAMGGYLAGIAARYVMTDRNDA